MTKSTALRSVGTLVYSSVVACGYIYVGDLLKLREPVLNLEADTERKLSDALA